jgi:DNA primase
MSTAADTIKQTLSMDTVARVYGFRPNRGGYIACPFHKDKTASLKAYEQPGRGFRCFGCSTGGSVIDFVMKLLDLSYPAALARLNDDFHLGLSMDKPSPADLAQARRRREEAERARQHYADMEDLYYALVGVARDLRDDIDRAATGGGAAESWSTLALETVRLYMELVSEWLYCSAKGVDSRHRWLMEALNIR